MKKIILASNNQGKLREFTAIFKDLNIEIKSQLEFSISQCEETGLSFIENAIIKARWVAKNAKSPSIADDSGLVIPALSGRPGIFSARYSGNHGDDLANNLKVLEQMQDIKQRQAMFICAIAYLRHEQDPCPIIANGVWTGTIAEKMQGENGFGYDSIFIPDEFKNEKITSAQLTEEQKNLLSHRKKAIDEFMQQYRKEMLNSSNND